MKTLEVTQEDIKNTITHLHNVFEAELMNCNEEDLEKYWHFKYNKELSMVQNLYEFYDLLKLYNNFCRRWEQAKHGSCCVVERVRDKYLMPKIKQFIDDMKTDNKSLELTGEGHAVSGRPKSCIGQAP